MKKLFSSLSPDKGSRHLIDEADALRDVGRYAEAAEKYAAYLAEAPKDYGIWVQRGNCLKDSGQYELARMAYDAALAQRSNDADLYIQFGHLSKLQGNRADAIKFYKKSLEINPDASDALFELRNLGGNIQGLNPKKFSRPQTVTSLHIYDISDLLIFLGYHNRVTGIQRVQYFFIEQFLNNKNMHDDHFVGNIIFCYLDTLTEQFHCINLNELKNLLDILSSDDADRKSLDRAIYSIKKTSLRVDFQKNDLFIIIGAFWINNNYLRVIYDLKSAGIRVGVYIYDLIPITHPQYVEEPNRIAYIDGFRTIMPMVDFVLTISNYVAKEVRAIIKIELDHDIPVIPVPLGHSLPETDRSIDISVDGDFLASVPDEYVLCVCTIEERKNHNLLVDIWSSLYRKYRLNLPSLVIVGRWGWHVEHLRKKIENSNYLDGKIVILGNLSDNQLDYLYKNCLLTAFPSFVEGWGLPVGESLAYGKPCLASNATAIPEVGGNFCKYINPYDLIGSIEIFDEILNDKNKILIWENNIKDNFIPRTWKETVENFERSIIEVSKNFSPDMSDKNTTILKPGVLYNISKTHIFGEYNQWNKRKLQFILKKGWHNLEEWGVWSGAPSSIISFFTDPSINEEIQIYFEIRLPPPEISDSVVLKSGKMSNIFHVSSEKPTWVKIDIPAGGNNPINIEITRNPESAQLSSERNLFIGLSALAFHPKSDVLSRIDILERLVGIARV
jgi:glycosyltransferase involved in cell wall biosynthesis